MTYPDPNTTALPTPNPQPQSKLFQLFSSIESLAQVKRGRAELAAWYDHSVGYLPRCVKFLGKELHYVIQAALLGQKVNIADGDPGFEQVRPPCPPAICTKWRPCGPCGLCGRRVRTGIVP